MDTNPNLDLQRPPMRPHRFNVLRGTDRGPQLDRCPLTLYSLETWNSTCDSASRQRNGHDIASRCCDLTSSERHPLSSWLLRFPTHIIRCTIIGRDARREQRKSGWHTQGGKVEPQLERENYLNHARKASNWAALGTTLWQGVALENDES